MHAPFPRVLLSIQWFPSARTLDILQDDDPPIITVVGTFCPWYHSADGIKAGDLTKSPRLVQGLHLHSLFIIHGSELSSLRPGYYGHQF